MTTTSPDADSRRGRRCAVIANPTKISEQFHDVVEKTLQRDGWVDTLWLETSADDPGRANLLARNFDLPLDQAAAVEVAFGGHTRAIDLIEVKADTRAPEHFAVMAGIGVDAMTMEETDDQLKDKIGTGAYFVAAGKALGRLPLKMTVRLDGRRPVRRQAMICRIGNVGDLVGNLTLLPQPRYDDGRLELFIASPHTIRHWLKLALRLITRRPKKDDQVDQRTGRTVTVRLDRTESYQLDGDVIGECTTLTATVKPGALVVCAPAAEPRP